MTQSGESKAPNREMSLEECKAKIKNLADEIRKIKSNPRVKDNNGFSEDERDRLRRNYEQIAKMAKRVAKLSKEDEESREYADRAQRAIARAKNYGSNLSAKIPTTTFDDVKGLKKVKEKVNSFSFLAEHPEIRSYYRIQGGLGMLMYGPPGTGKTMFAEAVANKMGLPLYIVTPADIFKPHVGESEESVRKLFDAIDEEEEGCILFVDECESIFSVRTGDTQDYKAAVTTELLQRINGFGDGGEKKRIMIAATNRPDMIDKAYLRYKRFSHRVLIDPPDEEATRAIIEGKLKGIALEGITVDEIVAMTKNQYTQRTDPNGAEERIAYYSAANLCGIVEEACRLAVEILQTDAETKKAGDADGSSKSASPIPLTREMFEKAFKEESCRPGISAEELKKYQDFDNIQD